MPDSLISVLAPLIFPLLVVSIVFFAYFYDSRRRIKVLSGLAKHIPGHVSKNIFQPSFNGDYRGIKFCISLIPGSRNTPPYLNISFYKRSSFRLGISRENILTRFGKKFGLQDVKIQDPRFDEKFLVSSNKADWAMQYLRDPEIRNAVEQLFSQGFESISANGNILLARKPNYHLNFDFQPQVITVNINRLGLLTERLN